MRRLSVAFALCGAVVAAGRAGATTIGPDPFGYTASDEVAWSWEDISATGRALGLADDAYQAFAIEFPFSFYGTDHTRVTVAANGVITFRDHHVATTNGPIPGPTGSYVDSLVAPFWDDLNPNSRGEVYVDVRGAPGDRRLLVQWDAVAHWPDAGAGSLSATLHEATGDLVFRYRDTDFGDPAYDAGASATVGVQDSPSLGLQWSYNQPAVPDGTALRFTTLPGPPPPPPPPTPGRVANPGAERGDLSGWTLHTPPGADAEALTAYASPYCPGYAPVEGDYLVKLKTDGPDSYTTMSQQLYLEAASVLGGLAAFDARDYAQPPVYNDHAEVRIYDAAGAPLATPWARDVASVGDYGYSPWEAWRASVPADGLYRLGYAVANTGDSQYDSCALFDAVATLRPLAWWQVDPSHAPGVVVGGEEADGSIYGPGGYGVAGMGAGGPWSELAVRALDRTLELEVLGSFAGGDHLTILGHYAEEELGALAEPSLRLYWRDGQGWQLAWNGTNATVLAAPGGGPGPGEPDAWFVLGPPTGYGLGYFGVDPDANTVWANVDHASPWGVGGHVPEPATVALLATGLAAVRRRRR
ncbi:MAG: PEP-CTERM sorting domain-containing protein [bacterium]